jgi:hypothetical protein
MLNNENYEENFEGSDSESSIELKPVRNEQLKKPRKKVEYVRTEARIKQFEEAKKKRMLNIEARKAEKELIEKEKKAQLESKVLKKAEIIKKKQAKAEKILDVLSDDFVDKHKVKTTKKKTKYIVVNDESSESESDEEVKIIKTKSKYKKQPQQIQQPPQIQQRQPIKTAVFF